MILFDSQLNCIKDSGSSLFKRMARQRKTKHNRIIQCQRHPPLAVAFVCRYKVKRSRPELRLKGAFSLSTSRAKVNKKELSFEISAVKLSSDMKSRVAVSGVS